FKGSMMAKRDSLKSDNTVAFRNCQGTTAIGTLLRISRAAVVFEVYNPYSIVQLSEVLTNVTIRRGERTIYDGKAVVTNLVNTGLMLIVSASLVDPWSDLTDLTPGPMLRQEVGDFIEDWSTANAKLTTPYKDAIINARNFLQELSRWLEHGETLAGIREIASREELAAEFVADVAQRSIPKLCELFATFEEIANQVPRKVLNTHKAFAQRELHPMLMCAPYIHRTFTKPLGYAGDYEMVNMILRNGWDGANTYAKVINAFPLTVDTAQAHRNRIDFLVSYLESESARVAGSGARLNVLNIGCGPAIEVQRFIKKDELANRTCIELLDFNDETLAHTRQSTDALRAAHRSEIELTYTHKSIHDLLQEASARSARTPRFDYVYCAGLFDYLSDPICSRLLELFYDWTMPGGLVVATNVHSSHPSKAFMEHILEWSLVLRDEAGMAALAPALGFQAVRAEQTGVNVFLEIRKPRSAEVSQ
ncbi:MAG TPA: class I SAM-dependent methyltransferase, partial [Pirellulaceae bacterium]|nr:class I SAM-dependent methyltransferase [Pirellulaceae bacterium]